MNEAPWYTKSARALLLSLALVAWPLGRTNAYATAEVVPPPPAELGELNDALLGALSAAATHDWEPARRAARASGHAWAVLRDGPSARTFPSTLIWRLDALETALNRVIEKEDARGLARIANHGLRLALAARRHFRGDGGLLYEQIRLDLRDLLQAADRGAFRTAERARKRILVSWERLRRPVARHASMQIGRMRALPVYYAICIDEMENALHRRHRQRLVRAARSMLDLVDTTEAKLR